MLNGQRFFFTEKYDEFGVPNSVPSLPLTLTYRGRSVEVSGLLDTGASVSVLPYNVGRQLGIVWEEQTLSVPLAGNLAPVEGRGVLVQGKVGQFPTVNLVFAWAESNDVPLILGRLNFFSEFDVCFYGSQLALEVRPKQN